MERREFLAVGAASTGLLVAGRMPRLAHGLPPTLALNELRALAIPTFQPSVHGWPFRNFGDYGNCGGMCWSALDRFLNRQAIERTLTEPREGSKLREEISARQWDTLNGWLAAKVVQWTGRPDQGHLNRGHSLAYMTRQEWPDVRKSLDDRIPINLILIQVEGYPPAANPAKNHQVLAYRYAIDGSRVTIWVYDPNDPDNDDVQVKFSLTGESLNGSRSNRPSLRMRGFFPVPYDRNLNVHIHRMSADGRVGPRVDHRPWSPGWTSVAFYGGRSAPKLLLLKQGNGKVHAHAMDRDGVVGPRLDTRDWTSGWTTASTYAAGGNDYLLMLKRSGTADDGKNVHIHQLLADGKIGAKVHSYSWSEGWTAAVPYRVGGEPYLFLLKRGSGVVHLHRVEADGSVGARIEERDWTGGWSSVCSYEIGGSTYLFLLKQIGSADDGHNVHIHRMAANGKVGPRVHTYDWSQGWTSAEPFTVNGRPYLFLLKHATGVVHIHQLTASGAVGARVTQYDWSSGWSTVRFYEHAGSTYLFLLKSLQPRDDRFFRDMLYV